LAHRRTPLVHALSWALPAWLAWLGLAVAAAAGGTEPGAVRYLALCLTACAGVAVLGARRPGVVAWDFVVAGLLAVLLVPLAEQRGLPRLDWLQWPRFLFLLGTLGVSIANYLPTRLWPSALLLAHGCAQEAVARSSGGAIPLMELAAVPWLALLMTRWQPASELDRTWGQFRDSYGGVWEWRMREQFNCAAANAGLTARIRWNGLRGASPDDEAQLLELIRAVLKRFGLPD
jgi:hypothetical protein